MNCKSCFTDNRKASNFCKGCGNSLSEKTKTPRQREGLLVGKKEEFTGIVFTRLILVFIFLFLGAIYMVAVSPLVGMFLVLLGLVWMPIVNTYIFPRKLLYKRIVQISITVILIAGFWFSWSI